MPPNPSENVIISKKKNKNIQTKSVRLSLSSAPKSPNVLECNLLKQFKDEVTDAIKNRKTFSIYGNWPIIREALTNRGWIERVDSSFKRFICEDCKNLLSKDSKDLIPLINNDDVCGDVAKIIIKSNLLHIQNYHVDFYWCFNHNVAEAFKAMSGKFKLSLINKFSRNLFPCTNKVGLCKASKVGHEVYELSHPRTYCLKDEFQPFWKDYNLTAAMSLLKYIVITYETKTSRLISPHGKIPYEIFQFACNECNKFIKQKLNPDVNDQFCKVVPQSKWDYFIDYYSKMVYFTNHFKQNLPYQTDESIVKEAKNLLNTLSRLWPHFHMDGHHNVWILKPATGNAGRGIHVCTDKRDILTIAKNKLFIAQKYIERPLLIYNTKFDIRQWFLISDSSPLTIWIWKEFCIRFSCQTYTLRKLHESIHLTNNCVQRKYFNNSLQDAALPNYSMWDGKQFQNYLTNIGHPEAYKNVIYPGMKQNIIASSLINRDLKNNRRNCFELFGADFMLTPDFRPWLIEINSYPSLQYTTPITERLVPQCLEDVIKVMVDYRNNQNASTGMFELIYNETGIPHLPKR